MAAPSISLTLEDQLTLHFKEIGEKRLNTQSWPRTPILEAFLAEAKPYKGGAYWQEQLEDGASAAGSAVDEGSDMPATQGNVTIGALYQPRWLVNTCYLDGIREMKISDKGDMGPILNWAQEQADKKVREVRELMAQQLVAASTSTAADGSTNIQTIFELIKASGTVGGVDPTSYAWWASTVDNTAASFSSNGPSRIRTALRSTRKYTGSSGPTVLFVSGTAHDAMKAHGYTKEGFRRAPDATTGPYNLGDPKYNWTASAPYDPDFMVENIPCYYDSHLDYLEAGSLLSGQSAGGVIVGVDMKSIYLRQRSGSVFSVDPWKPSERKLGSYTRILYGGNTSSIRRNSSLLITGVT